MSLTNASQLYIHLGPPKTATTSLQKAFQDYRSDSYYYGGIFYPRDKQQTLADLILSRILKQSNKLPDSIEDQIRTNLKTYNKILISEERILTIDKVANWKVKLSNLYSLLAEYDSTIILTVRNPIDAIPSYYQETFNGLPKSLQNNLSDFIKSDYCKIFRYKYFIDYLKNIGFTKVILVDYRELIRGKCTFNDFISQSESSNNQPIELVQLNKSKKNNDSRLSSRVSLKGFISKKIAIIPKPKVLKGKAYSKVFLDLLPNTKISKNKKLPIINAHDDNLKVFLDEYDQILKQMGASKTHN